MPIAFDPPASAPHGTLPTRAARAIDDEAIGADIFTQLLLAAATLQDAAATPANTPPPNAKTSANDAAAVDADALLALPLPATLPAMTPTPTVTIVATEKRIDVRTGKALAAVSVA